jgi:hypothetical protein
MFLAAIYPISERSAVNVTGKVLILLNASDLCRPYILFSLLNGVLIKINSSNAASFENDPDLFRGGEDPAQDDLLGDLDASDGLSASLKTALQIATATAAASSRAVSVASSSEAESRTLPIDFNLYKMFWGIQVSYIGSGASCTYDMCPHAVSSVAAGVHCGRSVETSRVGAVD